MRGRNDEPPRSKDETMLMDGLASLKTRDVNAEHQVGEKSRAQPSRSRLIHFCSLFGTFDALKILLGRAGIEVNKEDSEGKTLSPLLQNGPDDILEPISALLQVGADPELIDNYTSSMSVISCSGSETVVWLLKHILAKLRDSSSN